MNLAFKREIIPAFYQLLMDYNPWRIGRFDDMWTGIFLKRGADALGKAFVTGYPLCQHNKAARSTFKDLNAEARPWSSTSTSGRSWTGSTKRGTGEASTGPWPRPSG